MQLTTMPLMSEQRQSDLILDGGLEVEWDPDKADEVWDRHGVTFEEAATIYLDPLAATAYDEEHSDEEDRWATIGRSERDRLLVAVHTDRGSRMRLITAREAEPDEIREYEQGN